MVIRSITFLAVFLCICPHQIISQTGINTTAPRTTLEVAGDVEISSTIDIGTVNSLADGDTSTFLVQDTDNTIKTLDVSNPTGAALGYIQEYVIENMFQDFVQDFDTGIDATDYVLIAISANYNEELSLYNTDGQSDHYSLPYTATFISGGTWHIVANYPVARNADVSAIGEWTITTLIFSRDLSKQLGTVAVPMSGGSTATASFPVIN
ncbi:hypothetical protein POV27_10900 [Aureisphaera galaxeae]|uniref:hypothetical protein n=1 Tax=Aureisphaera galaxeae TaxID=1538023 RepID=UPI002350EC69|nr:hypothetical protein [Aureisphaera galaxeae]MDC8004557.1 hypothetical protein [Aureisphaera galaxeae]